MSWELLLNHHRLCCLVLQDLNEGGCGYFTLYPKAHAISLFGGNIFLSDGFSWNFICFV